MGNIMSSTSAVHFKGNDCLIFYNDELITTIKGTIKNFSKENEKITIVGQRLTMNNVHFYFQGIKIKDVKISPNGSKIEFLLSGSKAEIAEEIVPDLNGQIQVYNKEINLNGVSIIGHHNTITGHGNKIMGHHNHISGNSTKVIGDHNTILGDENSIFGDFNKAYGKENLLSGQHNQDLQ